MQTVPAALDSSSRIGLRNWLIALGIVALLFIIYLSNGDFQIGNDVKASVYLPDNLMNQKSFGFTPSRVPFMFAWHYKATDSVLAKLDDKQKEREKQKEEKFKSFSFANWEGEIDRKSMADLYRTGRITVLAPKYYLTPSVRTDPVTTERLYVNTFGPGAALMSLPAFAVMGTLEGDLSAEPWYLWYGGKGVAAFLVACSAAFVFLAARQFVSLWPAITLSLAFGIGTSVWSVSSQALWQHGPNEFFLALGTLALVRCGGKWTNAALCGFCYACAVACRPDSIVFALAATVYFAIVDRRALLRFVIAAIPIALLLAYYNWYYLGSPLRFGQAQAGAEIALTKTGSSAIWQTPWFTGLTGVLLSPGRGLLVYSPFLALSVLGAIFAWRDKRYVALRVLTVAVPLMIAIEARHYDWWGGWSWSYRKIVDVTPALAILLVPLIPAMLRRRWTLAVGGVLLAWSIFVQILGAFAFDLDGWNARIIAAELLPAGQKKTVVLTDISEARRLVQSDAARLVNTTRADIDRPEYRSRLWSWGENPIFFYAAHFRGARQTRIGEAELWIKQPVK